VSGYYHKFGTNDVFYNQLKTYPQNEFFIWNAKVFYNNESALSGEFASQTVPCNTGFVSLFEANVDRHADTTGFIYPWIIKSSDKNKLSTMSDASWYRDYDYGDRLVGSYRMSASIGREYFSTGLSGTANSYFPTGSALKNSFDYYKTMSPLYAYSSSVDSKHKSICPSCLITIPSIFYGSSIKAGTVDLKFYITGTLIGRLRDVNQNGELVQTEPVGSNGSGSVAGVALYNEGFIYLSGSWDLSTAERHMYGGAISTPKWLHFGAGIPTLGRATSSFPGPGVTGSANATNASSSFVLAFSGTNYIPNITMMAHAKKGELNHSNNYSYLKYNQTSSLVSFSGSTSYIEKQLKIKNVVSSSHPDPTGSFQKITYISKIGIYDDDKNLIAIASLAKPVKKTEDRDLTFKLKLDI
jgi:hypothetical protein